MARTAIPVLPLVKNTGEAETSTTIDQANGMVIANANPEKTVLRISNTGTLGNTIVRAGDSIYPALLMGQGDVKASVAATTGVTYMGPFDSARVIQTDGSMHVDFDAGVAGKITVLQRS